MGSRGRGGNRTPKTPAAVSGPGAMSARTDGGVAKPDWTGQKYGENKALNDQARSGPLGTPTPASTAPAPASSPAAQGRPVQDPWRPTERPGEPLTAGARLGAGPGMEDPRGDIRAVLLEAYDKYGDDDVRDLLEAMG